MSYYTESLKNIYDELSPEDENYTEELIAVAKAFRNFGEALTAFIMEHGYSDDPHDVNRKVSFIKQKFKEAGIEQIPRNLKKCFTSELRLKKREVIYQFCFAFHLNIAQSQDFFGRTCLQRGFDCHYIEEAIYYYAIANQLSYEEACRLIEKAPQTKANESINLQGEILYTNTIIKEINRAKSPDELLDFFYQNQEQFGYNNATAYHNIQYLWDKISKEDGLAELEHALLYPSISKKPKDPDKEEFKKRSVWDIYLQILGLYDFDVDNSPVFVIDTDRTLKPILKDNALLHPLAEYAFPDREGLEGILLGKHKSYELVRKTIILLVFYCFWTTLFLQKEKRQRPADPHDGERCFDEINRYLVDAGYPPLYAGNPYDWIFLFAMKDDYPMEAFRYYMRELYLHKEEAQS